jgi:hypothetical protein
VSHGIDIVTTPPGIRPGPTKGVVVSYNQPPPPPGGGYGAPQPAYGGAQPQKTSVMAIISLVTGILGVICCGSFIFGIAALVLGFLGRKEINESNGTKKGGGLATAGLVLGAIGVVLSAVYWILVVAGSFDGYY